MHVPHGMQQLPSMHLRGFFDLDRDLLLFLLLSIVTTKRRLLVYRGIFRADRHTGDRHVPYSFRGDLLTGLVHPPNLGVCLRDLFRSHFLGARRR